MQRTWHHREASIEAKLSHEGVMTVRWMEQKIDQIALVVCRSALEKRGMLETKET